MLGTKFLLSFFLQPQCSCALCLLVKPGIFSLRQPFGDTPSLKRARTLNHFLLPCDRCWRPDWRNQSGFRAKLAVFDFGNSEGNLVTPSNLKARLVDSHCSLIALTAFYPCTTAKIMPRSFRVERAQNICCGFNCVKLTSDLCALNRLYVL